MSDHALIGDSRRAPASVLILCPESPYPVEGGGAIRTASLVEYFGRRSSLDLIVFRQPGAPDPRAAIPSGLAADVGVVDLPYHRRDLATRARRNLVRYFVRRPPLNDRFAGFGECIGRWLQGRNYDLAIVEHFWCAPYVAQIERHAARVVLDLHNVESVLYSRLAESESFPAGLLARRFAQACEDLERTWLPRYSQVFTASDNDAKHVATAAGGARISVYPNTIPEAPRVQAPEEEVIAFSGNFGYHPNISAVRHFRREIWPLLRARWPGLVWRLIGCNPEEVARYTRGDDRIEATGPVKDAVARLAAARVVVAPLLAGSGTRLKILEAWAAGRAVVSTSVGAEGLGARAGEHLLVADAPDAFASAVSSLLESRELRARIGEAGRRLVEERFTWRHAWRCLEKLGM